MEFTQYIIAILVGITLGFIYFVWYWSTFMNRHSKDRPMYMIAGGYLIIFVLLIAGLYWFTLFNWTYIATGGAALVLTYQTLRRRFGKYK